jgi:hypothetical protein
MLDDHGGELFAMTNALAERVRKVGAVFNDSWVVGFWRADHGGHNVEVGR